MLLFRKKQSGFTLMEIVVATAIFAGTVTLMLGLFNSALRINRRVQALRQAAQGTRNFTESLTREIRNGRIDYNNTACPQNKPTSYGAEKNGSLNQALAIITFTQEQLCFYLTSDGLLHLSKIGSSGLIDQVINPSKFTIKPGTFQFIVRPVDDPAIKNTATNYPGIQPSVTIIAEFEVKLNTTEPATLIPYQTTISSDVYDIPHY